MDNSPSAPKDIRRISQIILQLGVLAFIVGWCFQILAPFILPIMWGVIISITIYPMFVKLKKRLGNRGKLASILITVTFLLFLIVPTYFFSESLIHGISGFKVMIDEGKSPIPPPGERVKDWPAFTEPAVEIWQEASENLQTLVIKHQNEFKQAGMVVLGLLAKTGAGILYFLISIILAGVFLAYSKEGGEAVVAIFSKLGGAKGVELASVSEATIRSVVKGILGVAVIQTFLAGIAFLFAGIPAAGLWTLLCLIFAIVQLGVGPVMIPMIFYVFNTADLTTAIIFAVWGVLTLISDNILKPILLGRGAPVPLLVVFLGSIGGFIATGFLGLFLGAVILSLGYKLFEYWLAEEQVVDDVNSAEPVNLGDPVITKSS